MLKVPNGQDPYTVIGQYIQNHITVIEDIIATIEIDGVRTNELFMVDTQEDVYFVWKSDWYEGEQNIALIDFFPVSDAQPEIVRCKDCMHRPTLDEDGELDFPPTYQCPCQCDDYYYSWMPEDDWFCGNAERRTE
jgi:L-rhamnose mutarotase